MKIAFLNIYNGVIDRGAETFVREVAGRLAKDHDVTLFQSGKGRVAKYKVIQIPVSWDWSNKKADGTLKGKFFVDYWSRQVVRFTLKCLPFILKGKYDVVVPVNGGWMPAILRIATWLTGAKMVISGQSGIGWDDRNNLFCFPDAFVAISPKAEGWAKRVNPLLRTRYIPNGVDLVKFSLHGKVFATGLDKPLVLCVGALTEFKRIDLVIKAVSKLDGVSLLVAGDGDLRHELIKLGKSLLGKRFMLAQVPYEKMPTVYRAADIFTLVSEPSEAFGNVFVEAMASGIPVVANDDPIRRGIVGEAGIFVEPTDTDSYAKAIKEALGRDWGNKPRKQAAKFDWDIIAGQYEDIFREL